MEFQAVAKFQRLSPSKSRRVVDLVRGMPVNDALDTLRFCRLRAAPTVTKVIRAALSSAVEQHDADADELYVKRIWINTGPIRYGMLPRMRGMWNRIRRRYAHVHVVLEDRQEEAGKSADGTE
jgi:large subunit ribosomal protein L22